MSHREAMSTLDTAWLRMDSGTNRMTIVGVMTCDSRLPYARLRQLIEERFLRHARFRDRVVLEGDTPYWERDPWFDLDFHVRRTALPGRGGKRQLHDLVGDLLTTPLDRERPLWQFHLVERYGKGSAVIARIHHCYADGIALMHVLMAITDDPGAAVPSRREASSPSMPSPDAADGGGLDWLAPVSRTLDVAWTIGTQITTACAHLLRHPEHAADYALKGVDAALEAARLVVMPTDSATRLKAPLAGIKRAAWSGRFPLRRIKALAHATECSVNDVLLSAVAGSLRDYLREKGDGSEGVEIRALVPVNLRPGEDVESLGNRFGLVALLLPVYMSHPLKRLYEVKRRMQALKRSTQAYVTLGLLAAVGMSPKSVQDEIVGLLARRATAVMTNVPGPGQPRSLGGCRIREIVFWVPQAGNIGLGMSVLSYNGGVQFGVLGDAGVAPDPERIVSAFPAQLAGLEAAVAAAGAPRRASRSGRAARISGSR